MNVPCQAGECPKIEQTKLEIRLQVTAIIRDEFSPILAKMQETSEGMAVHAERLRVGSEQFKDHSERIDGLESWQDTVKGEEKAGEKAGRRAGIRWALGGSFLTGIGLKVVDYFFRS